MEVISAFEDTDTDFAFITETWLTSQNNKTTAIIKEHDYIIKHIIRNDPDRDRGGGVGIMLKKDITNKTLKCKKEFTSFQHVTLQITPNQNEKLTIMCVYRLLYVPISTFYTEFAELMEIFSVSSDKLIIAGDINIHMETQETSARRFNEILDMFGLKQHIQVPTHYQGHTIDVVITRNSDNNITDITKC